MVINSLVQLVPYQGKACAFNGSPDGSSEPTVGLQTFIIKQEQRVRITVHLSEEQTFTEVCLRGHVYLPTLVVIVFQSTWVFFLHSTQKIS